jgi:Holliday junction DNA helicase RuvA
MIGRLTGKVLAHEEDGVVVVDVAGVGYEIATPLGTVGRAVEDAGGRATFYVHTHVREDIIALFGFATEADRTAFRALISVSNVGPKTAVAVLSALPGPELGKVIARGELGRLTKISGVGKKTAERLLLELRGKLSTTDPGRDGAATPSPPGVERPRPASSREELVVGALTNMGYRPAEAERALAALNKDEATVSSVPIPELIREALAILAK